jgi:hypothetical protein
MDRQQRTERRGILDSGDVDADAGVKAAEPVVSGSLKFKRDLDTEANEKGLKKEEREEEVFERGDNGMIFDGIHGPLVRGRVRVRL